MLPLKFTLLSDGRTDANLIPIITWTLREAADVPIAQGSWADLQRLPKLPSSFAEKIRSAIDLFPCDILFVHRDAERDLPKKRYEEIRAAFEEAFGGEPTIPAVALVPVRMMEAWLIFDEVAIRRAAGNPNSQCPLELPPLNRIEALTDPKKDLKAALMAASELKGRRRKKFHDSRALWRVVELIEDFSPLRQLGAYRAFEQSIKILKEKNWHPGFYEPCQ